MSTRNIKHKDNQLNKTKISFTANQTVDKLFYQVSEGPPPHPLYTHTKICVTQTAVWWIFTKFGFIVSQRQPRWRWIQTESVCVTVLLFSTHGNKHQSPICLFVTTRHSRWNKSSCHILFSSFNSWVFPASFALTQDGFRAARNRAVIWCPLLRSSGGWPFTRAGVYCGL